MSCTPIRCVPPSDSVAGTFIYNNYRQALKIKTEDGAALASFSETHGTTSDDFERFLIDEREYLKGLHEEPPEIIVKISYVDALQALDEAQYVNLLNIVYFYSLTNVQTNQAGNGY